MKSLLFTLGLALCCFLQANGDEPFATADHSKIVGPHTVVAIITNCQKMKGMLPHMSASHINFEKQNEDLLMTMEMKTPHGCKTMKPVLKKENGVYVTFCGKGGKKIVEMLEMKEGAIFTTITLINKGGSCKIATLAVKNVADTQKYLEDFKAFAARNGLSGEEVHVLSTEDMCPRST